MKKTVSLIIVLALVLALGVSAFADSDIVITKNPTDEKHVETETAWFVSGANSFDSVSWFFLSPQNVKHSPDDFRTLFPQAVFEGRDSTRFAIHNLSSGMDGWRVFCIFSKGNSRTESSMALLRVSPKPSYTVGTTVYNSSDPGYGLNGKYSYDSDGHLEYNVYYTDGSHTTYYYNGCSLTDNNDGSYIYRYSDGTVEVYNDQGYYSESKQDGSYYEHRTDGSWIFYDATTGFHDGSRYDQ